MVSTYTLQSMFVSLSCSAQQSPITTFILLACLLVCFMLIRRDFIAFLALGPGGTPSNFKGYLKIKLLSFFAIADPYQPADVPASLVPQSGHLKYLPPRFGPRPTTKGIAPHRQQDQPPTPAAFNALSLRIYELAEKNQVALRLGTSCLERHGPGLFAISPATKRESRNGTRRCSEEICHSHPSDGSTHLTLHPADAALLLQAGWGERHPLAKGGWLGRFVPSGFVLVYAPRTEAEVAVVMQVIGAAVWWVAGLDLSDAGNGKQGPACGDRGGEAKGRTCFHCGR